MLNSLYGIFGRNPNGLKTILVKDNEIIDYYGRHVVKKWVKIDEDLNLLLIQNNLEFDVINKLNVELEHDLLKETQTIVKSNVAIASAITSHARIHMMRLKVELQKLGIKVIYTDTDSIITDKPIPKHLIGDGLGMLKDELNGKTIKTGYFFGVKRYILILSDGSVKTVFSGIPRDSLTTEEIEALIKGENITKRVPDQFTKNLNNFDISIQAKVLEIINKPSKELVGNDYIPTHINGVDFKTSKQLFFKKLKNYMQKGIKFLKSFNF